MIVVMFSSRSAFSIIIFIILCILIYITMILSQSLAFGSHMNPRLMSQKRKPKIKKK